MTTDQNRQNLLRGAVMSVSLSRPQAADSEIPVLGVRMTSATGVYDDGVPVRTIEDIEREEAERRADVAARDAEEEERLAAIAERHAAEESEDDDRLVSELLAGGEQGVVDADPLEDAEQDVPPQRPVVTARIAASIARPATKFSKTPSPTTPVRDHPWRAAKAAAPADKPEAHGGNSRPIVCVDPFRIFPSEKAACRAIDAAPGAIRSAMRTGSRAGGCLWRDASPAEVEKHLPHLAVAAAKLRTRREQLAADRQKPPAPPRATEPSRPPKRHQPTPVTLPPVPTPSSAPARSASPPAPPMLTTDMVRFIAKAMLSLGKGGATVGEEDLDATISAAKTLAATREIIGAIERGEAVESLLSRTQI